MATNFQGERILHSGFLPTLDYCTGDADVMAVVLGELILAQNYPPTAVAEMLGISGHTAHFETHALIEEVSNARKRTLAR